MINCTGKARGIDKGFYQQERESEPILPVSLDSSFAQGENFACKILIMAVGQYQKARIVCHKMESIILQAVPPADPAITSTTFQSCGGKAEEAEPFIVIDGNVPDCLDDFRQ